MPCSTAKKKREKEASKKMLTLLKEKRLKVVEEEIYALIPFYSSDKIIHLMLIYEPGNDRRK